jgi:hypothetical protein
VLVGLFYAHMLVGTVVSRVLKQCSVLST